MRGAALFLGAAVSLASAHISNYSLQGGEKFQAGETVVIKWKNNIYHNTFHIAISTDGKTWQKVDTVFRRDSTYAWKVPALNTQTARLRVCQLDGSVKVCPDSVNSSFPNGKYIANTGSVYVLVSGNFTIETPTALARPAGPALRPGPRIVRDARGRSTRAARRSASPIFFR